MKSLNFVVRVNVPEVDDVAAAAPQYATFARGDGRFLFDLVMRPESFLNARAVTLELGLPALAGVAEVLVRASDERPGFEFNSFAKQAVGSFLRVLMEANGFRKTDRRKAVPHPAFAKCQMFELVGNA